MDDVNTSALDKKRANLQSEFDTVMNLIQTGVKGNTQAPVNAERYDHRQVTLVERYEAVRSDLADIERKFSDRAAKREKITRFLDELKQRDGVLDMFDEQLWLATVESMSVCSESEVSVTFKNGAVIRVRI